MDFRLLGPVEVRSGGQPLRAGGLRQRAPLAYLALRSGEVVPAFRTRKGWFSRSLISLLAVAMAVGAAPSAGADSSLIVGISGNPLRWEPDAAAELGRTLGIGGFRISILWTPGSSRIDSDVATQLEQAVQVEPGTRIVVSVYSAYGRDAPKTQAARDAYCAYVADMITRFPQINDVEIWIEPNKTQFWAPQFGPDEEATAPAEYEALLARCWDVLHAVRPTVNLIAPGTSPRGNDRPNARSNISESPGNFIRRMGDAYRASLRRLPIFDTVGHNAYGDFSAERPWRRHRYSGTIAEGDWAKLLQALWDGFHGTGQPIPGHCLAGKCVSIWYMEIGYQTTPDPDKAPLYHGRETDPHPVPAYAGGDTVAHPSATSLAPDQATQIVDGIQLAYCQPYVGAYFMFNLALWDDPDLALWQSSLFWPDRTPKPSLPFAQRVIAQVNAHTVDCANLKGGSAPTAFQPLRGVDVASVTFARQGDSLVAHIRTGEDASYTASLERKGGPARARRRGQLPAGWLRTLRFPLAGRPAASYRIILRFTATANMSRTITIVSRRFRVT